MLRYGAGASPDRQTQQVEMGVQTPNRLTLIDEDNKREESHDAFFYNEYS